MISDRYTITTNATEEVELLLTRFERDRDAGPLDLADYTPPRNDPAYKAVVTELARIDLERWFDAGHSKRALTYIQSFPDVFNDAHHRTQLAFEEYRLRRRSGEDVSATSFGKLYQVDGSHWPKLKLGTCEGEGNTTTSRRFTKDELAVPSVHYPRVGETIAGYPLVERLGEGVFSRVFLARQPDLAGRLVVLKVTPLSTDESDQLARLQHTNVIPVYSIHRADDLTCICMPFLGATTLADVSFSSRRWASFDGPAEELVSTLQERRRSTLRHNVGKTSRDAADRVDIAKAPQEATTDSAETSEESKPGESVDTLDDGLTQYSGLGYVDALVVLAIGAVEGLAHAHRQGIVHRDLKPANILVSDDGRPVLLDFNLAVSSQETRTRIVGGTLPYMSPQQLAALETGAAADTRDDVFSMGVILYELLSGELPFACPKSGEAFELSAVIRDRQRPPKSLRSLNAGVSPGLEAIISRCLAADRESRYADATELLEDLSRHRQQLPLKFAPNRSVRERLAKWLARHPRISSASSVATFATIFLLMCGIMIWQRGERIARLQVESKLQRFQNEMPKVITALSIPGREPEILEHAVAESTRLLEEWQVGADNWKQVSGVSRLDDASRGMLTRQLARLSYLIAGAEADLALQADRLSPRKVEHENASLRWNRYAAAFYPDMKALVDFQSERMLASRDRMKKAETRSPKQFDLEQFDLEQFDFEQFDLEQFDFEQLDLRAMAAASSEDALLLRELTRKQLDRQPTNATFWFNLAVSNWHLGDLQDAVAGFDVCDRLQPRSVAILFNRGVCNLDRGQPVDAKRDFSACLEINPRLATPRFNRAIASYQLGDLPAALDDLDALVRSDQARTRMVLMRARVKEALGRVGEAKADRQSAMKIPPQDASDWVARGVSRLAESPEAALADFHAAIKVKPNDFHALGNMAHVYAERLQQPRRAIEVLTRLVKLRPNSAAPLAARGILLGRQARIEAALSDARAAMKLSPTGLEQLQIAGIHALVGEHADEESELGLEEAQEAALLWLARALQTDPKLAMTAKSDPDLASVKEDSQFRRLIGSATLIQSAATAP